MPFFPWSHTRPSGSDATPPFRLRRQGSTTHRLPPSSHLLALSLPSNQQPPPLFHEFYPCPKSKRTVNSTERRQVRSAQVALTYTMMPALLNILPCQLLRSESRLPELTECCRMHTSCTHRCVLVVVATIGPTWRR
jgi:hypothetical protein